MPSTCLKVSNSAQQESANGNQSKQQRPVSEPEGWLLFLFPNLYLPPSCTCSPALQPLNCSLGVLVVGGFTVQLSFRLNGEVLVRLVFLNRARKFVGLAALLFFALPFGLSVTDCYKKAAPIVYCNPATPARSSARSATIILCAVLLSTTGESLNFGQIGQVLTADAPRLQRQCGYPEVRHLWQHQQLPD